MALLLFPGLWRELGRRLRVVLVVASGLMLAAGTAAALSGRFASLSIGERAMTVVGLSLLGAAWLGVALAAVKR